MQQKDINGQGVYFINSGIQNTGIKGKTNRPAKTFAANTITIDFFGNVYYRPFQYKMATHNHVFSLSGDVIRNANVGLYLVVQMAYLKKMFSYSNMGTWSKMKDLTIRLPIKKRNAIDFDFMEDYIRLLKARYMHELETYLSVAGFDDCTLTQEEAEAIRRLDAGGVKMEEKRIVDIFDVRNSHNILKSDVVFGSGNTPYVTASEGSNSIVSYIDYDEGMIEKGNSIMIGGKTLVITYQPDDFFSNDSHNLVLRVKEEKGQVEEAQLYMVSALYKSLSHKYSWGNSISNKKIQADMVFLPVNSSHQIDFAFMENYIRAVKKLCVGCLKDAISRGWEREGDT